MPRGRRRRFAAHRHALGSAAHTPDAHRYGPLVERAPIGTLVNTHSDGDHWWANQEVAAAEIIATEAASAVMEDESPAEMKRFGALAGALRLAGSVPWSYPRRGDIGVIATYASEALAPFEFDEVRLVPPTRTFSGELELEVGGREVRLIEVGPAHTPGDLVVWVPDAKIAIAADILFIGVTPRPRFPAFAFESAPILDRVASLDLHQAGSCRPVRAGDGRGSALGSTGLFRDSSGATKRCAAGSAPRQPG